MSNYTPAPFMTRAEVEASVRKGNAQARTLAPLFPGELFRFPVAVRAVAASMGLHTAAECAQEWANEPVTLDAAMIYARTAKPL